MSYVIYKSNGEQLTVVNDGAINQTTDLTLVGRNYPSYGQILDQNFIKLLENFAGPKNPTKSLQGQLWYDTANKKLKIYVGSSYKSLPRLEISSGEPLVSEGDFWWNSSENQLNYFNGSSFVLVGPQFTGTDGLNAMIPELVKDTNGISHYVLKHQVFNLSSGNPEIVAITSTDEFLLAADTINGFTKIKRGINFGTDSTANVEATEVVLEGSTVNVGNGKAVLSYNGRGGLLANNVSGQRLQLNSTAPNGTQRTVLSLYTDNNGNSYVFPDDTTYSTDLGTTTYRFGTVYAEATSAQFADIAERYRADASYEPGTVLRIGGEEEVTICNRYEDEQYAGVVSTNPAYTMNDSLEPSEKCPYIALKGRVPVKIKGSCKKGQVLVTSDFPGHAEVRRTHQRPNELAVIGKALQDFDGEFGVVEVMLI